MQDRVKAGVLSGIIAGSVLLFVNMKMRENEKEPETTEPDSLSDVVPTDDYQSFSLYTNDEEKHYLGEVEINPNIYTIIEDKGIQLSNYPDLSMSALDSHDYVSVNNQRGITTGSAINMRSGPGTEYDILRTFDLDTTVQLIAKSDNDWYLVQQGTTMGFVSGDYIREINDQSIVQQMYDLPGLIPVVQATDNVNVRPEPNTNNQEHTVLTVDKTLDMVRRLDNGWYEVIYQGKPAYVCGDYVREAYRVDAPIDKVAYINKDTFMSDEPFGMPTTAVPYLECAKIYKEIEGYYYVECNGYVGFVPKTDCSILTGTFAVVDTSSQTLTLYRNNEVLLQFDVVTGKDTSPTDFGLHDIDAKATDAWLTGADYSVHVNYWMPFNGGEGLHDAEWRDAFGGSIYHENGSHGCVNMPPEVTPAVYEALSVGDKVLVKR